jgi:ketosteroid isomerase-like protein
MATMDTDTDAASVARRYLAVVADRNAPADELAALIDERAEFVEHPNRLVPTGRRRGRAATLEAFAAGKSLLARQELTVHELVASGETAAARLTWRGVLAIDAGPLRAGTELAAEIAQFITVRDGRIVRLETFDCYEPFPEGD